MHKVYIYYENSTPKASLEEPRDFAQVLESKRASKKIYYSMGKFFFTKKEAGKDAVEVAIEPLVQSDQNQGPGHNQITEQGITEQDEKQCPACLEPVNDMLECRHSVHFRCVAMTGKEECPLCRKHVKLPKEHCDLLIERRRILEEEKKLEDEASSLALARDLSSRGNRVNNRANNSANIENQVRRSVLNFPGYSLEVDLRPPPDRWDLEELVLSVSRLTMAVHARATVTSSDECSLSLFRLMYSVNETAAISGLGVKEILDALAMLTD
jgi:hypothetical protein